MTNGIQQQARRILTGLILLAISMLPVFGQTAIPKTVQDYFKLLPDEYFTVFCCNENKSAFIKKYVTVNDAKNGFMEGADLEEDPEYQGFALKIFPSPNGRQILGLYSHSIKWEDYYFLEYKNGKLLNVSAAITSYSQDNIYEFPRFGTRIKVYKKKFSSPTKQINVDATVKRGKYLYSLNWHDGKFVMAK